MGDEQGKGLSWVGRLAAVAALGLALLAASWLLLGKEDGYAVKDRFQAATNVVKGNLFQGGGRKVGKIEKIELAGKGEAELTLKIDDERVKPLRSGTQATLRIASLSGSANRYVDLRIPPAGGQPIEDGGVIGSKHTTSAVDDDHPFPLFQPPTRKEPNVIIPRH